MQLIDGKQTAAAIKAEIAEEVNRLMKQFDQMRKMMRMVSGMGNSRMAQMAAAMKMKGGKPF